MSCTPAASEEHRPATYDVTMSIEVNGKASQPQSVNVRPGNPVALHFRELPKPVEVQLSASPAALPNAVQIKTRLRGHSSELAVDWEESMPIGGHGELAVSAGEPPVHYRFVVTAEAPSTFSSIVRSLLGNPHPAESSTPHKAWPPGPSASEQ